MRKILVLSLMMLMVFCFSGFSENTPGGGLKFGVDAGVSFAEKVYISENISYMYRFSNGLGLNAGFRLTENILHKDKEEYVYYIPYLRGYLENFYLGAGLLINSEILGPTLYLDTGFEFGNWEIGNGLGCVLLGLEYSPTLSYVPAEDESTEEQFGSAVGTIFTTIFNFFKVDIGFTWFLKF